MKKRLLGLALTVIALVALLTVGASAEGNVEIVEVTLDEEATIIPSNSNAGIATLAATTNEVKLNDIEYGTLSAALTDATDEDVITLIDDVPLTEAVNIYDDITLDLNGHTITRAVDSSYALAVLADVTIVDSSTDDTGKIVKTGTYGCAIFVASGSLDFQGGTIDASYIGIQYGQSSTTFTQNSSMSGDAAIKATFSIYKAATSNYNLVVSGGYFNTAYLGYCGAFADGYVFSDEITDQASPFYGFASVIYDDTIPTTSKIGDAEYKSLANAIIAAQDGDTIQVVADNTMAAFSYVTDKKITIDLGGYEVTAEGLEASGGGDVTIQNGTLLCSSQLNALATGTLTLDHVDYTSTGNAGIYVQGATAVVNVTDCSIKALVYGIATNAGTEVNYGVTINVSDTTFNMDGAYTTDEGTTGYYGTIPVFINVPGTLTVTDCIIYTNHVGVLVRGGTATVSDTTIYHNGYTAMDTWGTGNAVPSAVITVGNSNTSGSYQYPAICTMANITMMLTEDEINGYADTIYIEGNGTDGNGATLILNSDLTVDENSAIVIKDDAEIIINSDVTLTNNGTFANDGIITMKVDATIDNGTAADVNVYFNSAEVIVATGDSYTATQAVVDAAVSEAVGSVTDVTIPDEGFDATEDAEIITTINTAAAALVAIDSDALASDDSHIDTVNALDALFEAAVTADDSIGDLTTDAKEPTSEVSASESAIDTSTGVEVSGLALSVYGGDTAALVDDTTTTVYIDVTEKDVADADTLVDNYDIDNETAIVLEIKPMVTVENGEPTISTITNDQLQTPVTFKIYLSENFAGNRATVYHITESGTVKIYNCTVNTDENGSYIQLTVTEFSKFILEPWIYTTSSGSSNMGTIIDPDATTATPDTSDEEEETGFVDVDRDDYFYDAVEWAVENGVTTGKTSTTFAPDDIATRADVLTFLYRGFGAPDTDGENVFADVVEGSYYSDAVNWGIEMGITNGIGNGLFGSEKTCTRAQIITFLWRATGSPEMDGDYDFTDVEAGSYYEMALLWAVEEGITNGLGDGTFGVEEPCTRAQIVTFLYRFLG